MSFLNPLLLFAALGLGLPILAHMLNRFQVKQTDWAAMQFLNRSVRVRSRQLRLRDILLLILRCLALLLLVFAVAKPAMDDADGVAARVGEARAGVIIALDTSYSMLHSDGAATRFDRAMEKVEDIAAGIRPGAPVSVVLLGEEHRVITRDMAYDTDRFTAVLSEQKPTPGTLDLETVPAALMPLVESMKTLQKEVYIVTDLQAKDWATPSPWLLEGLKALSDVADVLVLPVGGTPENLAVTDFELFSGLLRKGTVARYRATVRNYAAAPVANVRVKCLMDGVNVDSKVIPSIKGRSAESVSLFVPFHNAGTVTLSAELETDGLPLDNVRRTVAQVRDRVSILCVEGQASGLGSESFIAKALRARGGASAKEDFKVRSVSWLSLPSQNLKDFNVVILSDVPEITETLAMQLRDYVREGNGLIWFGGDTMKAAVWNERSALKGAPLLPARIGSLEFVGDERGAGRSLDPILPMHPVCRSLRSLPKDLLSEAQFQHVLNVEPRVGSTSVLNLSGSATPILLEQSIGRGHVFMFTTSATPAWNNMALTPVFPMLMQQMVTYLTGREFETSQWVGGSLSLSYPDRPDANDGVFETPSGEIIRVPVREHAGQYVALLDHASEAGFYVARVSVQSPGYPMAVNLNVEESDVRSLALDAARADFDVVGVRLAESAEGFVEDVRTGVEYGRMLLIGALLFFVVESLLAAKIFRSGASRGVSPAAETEAA